MVPGLGLPAGTTGWLLLALLCAGVVVAAALVGVARLFPPPRSPVDPPVPAAVPDRDGGMPHTVQGGVVDRR